jgi:hypothetical protein
MEQTRLQRVLEISGAAESLTTRTKLVKIMVEKLADLSIADVQIVNSAQELSVRKSGP